MSVRKIIRGNVVKKNLRCVQSIPHLSLMAQSPSPLRLPDKTKKRQLAVRTCVKSLREKFSPIAVCSLRCALRATGEAEFEVLMKVFFSTSSLEAGASSSCPSAVVV